MNRITRNLLAGIAVVTALTLNAHATDDSWTATNGTMYWEDASNWSAGWPSNNWGTLYITNAITKSVKMHSPLDTPPTGGGSNSLVISNLVISAPASTVNTLLAACRS
jgi:hypothetical protein